MRGSVWLVLILLTSGLAGCVGTGEDIGSQSTNETDTLDISPSSEQLFEEPQSAVHPGFGLPTYTTLPEELPEDAPEFWQPIEANEFSVDELSADHLSEDPNETISYGTGIAVWGEIVLVPGRGTEKAWIVDIEDPEDPEILSEFEAGGRDGDILGFPDGSLFAVFATDNGVVPIWDITDPENPVEAAVIEPDRGSHNVELVPGTPYLYNSAGDGGGSDTSNLPGGGTEGTAIYNLSDPYNPELEIDFENGYSCHDIKFSLWPGDDKYRAYCAGYEVSQIWDIEDPADPELIVTVPVHHGVEELPSTAYTPYRFSHMAMSNADGTVLIVGDETGGGAQPGCDVQASEGPVTASGPLGNLYFYDITDEENPMYMGALSADAPALMSEEMQEDPEHATSSCTAHFGQLIPAEDRDLLAVAFYAPGVVIVDFTDPMNPQIVEQWDEGTNTWDVWFYNGYLITGDISRGMDILELN